MALLHLIILGIISVIGLATFYQVVSRTNGYSSAQRWQIETQAPSHLSDGTYHLKYVEPVTGFNEYLAHEVTGGYTQHTNYMDGSGGYSKEVPKEYMISMQFGEYSWRIKNMGGDRFVLMSAEGAMNNKVLTCHNYIFSFFTAPRLEANKPAIFEAKKVEGKSDTYFLIMSINRKSVFLSHYMTWMTWNVPGKWEIKRIN
jgi:hypothetical protein